MTAIGASATIEGTSLAIASGPEHLIETARAVCVSLPDYIRERLTLEMLDDSSSRALAGLARQQAMDGSALSDWAGTYRRIARAVIWRLGKERA